MRGIGIDIIEIKRIKKSIESHGSRFLDKLLTRNEQLYCQRYANPYPSYAGRFAAKEAVVKALGTGINGKITWLDIEILNDPSGKPTVQLSSSISTVQITILLSISHCKEYATAVALWL